MNKKFILPISLMLLVGLVVFVSASMIPERSEKVESWTNIHKGWNLIQGFYDPSALDGQTLEKSNIKAIYAFVAAEQEYVRVYPNPEEDKLKAMGDVDDQLAYIPFWVYSEKTERTEYWLQEPLPIKDLYIFSGWNFIGVTPEMVGKSLSEIKGSCNILQSYIWNSDDQKWDVMASDEKIVSNDAVSFGFITKVSNDCRFNNQAESTITQPPSIPSNPTPSNPNPSTDNSDLILQQDFGSLTFNKILGQEYIEREYRSLPLSYMDKGDAAKYGSPVGINAIIIDFNQMANNFIPDVLEVYSDSEWTKSKVSSMNVYDIYQKSNNLNRVALWTNNEYLVIIHSSDGFHGDGEELLRQYLNKYPSTLN